MKENEIKKGDVVEVTVPSTTGNTQVKACVLEIIETSVCDDVFEIDYIMYSQNRLFRMHNAYQKGYGYDDEGCPIEEITVTSLHYEGTISEYVIIPEMDEKLK